MTKTQELRGQGDCQGLGGGGVLAMGRSLARLLSEPNHWIRVEGNSQHECNDGEANAHADDVFLCEIWKRRRREDGV